MDTCGECLDAGGTILPTSLPFLLLQMLECSHKDLIIYTNCVGIQSYTINSDSETAKL